MLDQLVRAVSQASGTGQPLPVVGIQARVGMPGVDSYVDRPPPNAGPEFVRCAFSYTPLSLRGKPLAWLVVGDQDHVKRDMLLTIASVEGPIVAAANEAALRRLKLPREYFASGTVLGAESVRRYALDPSLEALGFACAVFASGSRALVLATPPDFFSREGMQAAILEMWLLSYAKILVVTENSTFWIPAVSFFNQTFSGNSRVYVFTRGKRCYPMPTREPVSDGGYRSRAMTDSKCYVDSVLNPTLTWLPPDSFST
jgi:hypothetical protein